MTYHSMTAETAAACCEKCGRSYEKAIDGVVFTVDAVELDGRKIVVGPRKAQLLKLLARSPGSTVHREHIERSLWGDRDVDLHILDVNVMQLRRKLAGSRLSIRTAHGIGYSLHIEKGATHD